VATDPDPMIRRVVGTLRDAPEVDPDLTGRVMTQIRTAPRSWWLAPRTLWLTPLHLLGVAVGVAVLVTAAWFAGARTGAGTDLPSDGARQVVQFHLVAPDANSVVLVGDFNDWELGATPLRRSGRPGVWTVDVSLAPGLVKYAFVIDGNRWVTDPYAAATISDEFGGSASYLRVGGPS